MSIEWWVVLATLAGPIVAVQTQKWIERATENRLRKYAIFNALMVTAQVVLMGQERRRDIAKFEGSRVRASMMFQMA